MTEIQKKGPKRTVLWSEHQALRGKMMSFAGWSLPVEYSSLRKEHERVRQNVGLFDVSHMGEIRLKGKGALEALELLTTNEVGKLKKGEAQYSLLLNESGGILDDIILYCVEKNEDYLLCVNAINTKKNYDWILKHAQTVQVIDESEKWGQIAIQGPKAKQLLSSFFPDPVQKLKSFSFVLDFFQNAPCFLARTGYTGEEGFEIFVSVEKTISLWRSLLDQGKALEVLPIGLGARNTLRLEMSYPLYGQEIHENISPHEAGLKAFLSFKKNFIGQKELRKKEPVHQKLMSFIMLERGIPREKYKIFSFEEENEEIGYVTSGAFSPSLKKGIGMAYIKKEKALYGECFYVLIRNLKVKGQMLKASELRALIRKEGKKSLKSSSNP